MWLVSCGEFCLYHLWNFFNADSIKMKPELLTPSCDVAPLLFFKGSVSMGGTAGRGTACSAMKEKWNFMYQHIRKLVQTERASDIFIWGKDLKSVSLPLYYFRKFRHSWFPEDASKYRSWSLTCLAVEVLNTLHYITLRLLNLGQTFVFPVGRIVILVIL